MKIKQIAKITEGQDGVIFGNELFRFKHRGKCVVYDLGEIELDRVKELTPTTTFMLDKVDLIAPHSNSVCFGTEYYAEGDEFPLLYSNVYNNYARCDDRRIGVCCVYRLRREGAGFVTSLVQLIEIGFCEDAELWKAYPDRHGERPYGNFLVDREGGYYHAFVMRSEEKGTRYFKFKLPSVSDGELDTELGIRRVVLRVEDALDYFDCPYHRFIQGAALYNGVIYSAEGFCDNEVNRPAMRLISLEQRRQLEYIDLMSMGYTVEPEMIDFRDGVCYYSDAEGNLFNLVFE